jgi:hypothetical protein
MRCFEMFVLAPADGLCCVCFITFDYMALVGRAIDGLRAVGGISWQKRRREIQCAPANHLSSWRLRKRCSVPPDWLNGCATWERKMDQLCTQNLLHVILCVLNPYITVTHIPLCGMSLQQDWCTGYSITYLSACFHADLLMLGLLPFSFVSWNWYSRLWRIQNRRVSSSGIWRHVVCWVATDVSEEHIASIFRVEGVISARTSKQACYLLLFVIHRQLQDI